MSKNQPMKICISNEFYDLHRGEKDFILAKTLSAKDEFEVSILHSNHLSTSDEMSGHHLRAGSYKEKLSGTTIKIHKYRAFRLIRKTSNKKVPYLIPSVFSYLFQLWRISPDVIIDTIYTTLTPRSLLNGLYAWLFNKRMILIDPGDDAKNKVLVPGERGVIRRSLAIITCNAASSNRILAKYQLGDSHKIIVHHKILNVSDFKLSQENVRECCTLGYVGRFVKAKGFDKFLEMSETLGTSAKFLAVGNNEDEFSIPNNIEFINVVHNKALSHIYSAIDILILPDLSNFRSYPTVVQEALLCGSEVWVGNISGEYFPNPGLLHFFEHENTESLKVAMSFFSSLTKEQKYLFRHRFSNFIHNEMNPNDIIHTIESILSESKQ
jgi:glycosyltransferase involved in cell wall biosynthesis